MHDPLMAVPSIEFLSRYLENEGSEDDPFPWNKLTCLAVVCYVIKKNHGLSPIINSLDSTAEQYLDAENKCRRLIHRKKMKNRRPTQRKKMKNRMQTISQLFVKSFIPETRIDFTVPELDHLSDKDKMLKRSEILAVFLDFLVQILHREANVDTAREQRYAPLKKALSFLLAVLGDKPFDYNNQKGLLEEQVKDLLTECEALANEAGHFIYSSVFSIPVVEDETFYSHSNVLLEKFKISNANIKQYCIKFSELPIHAVPRSNVVDSFFIIQSQVDDLDSFLPQEFFSMKDQIAMLRDELRTSQTLLKFIEPQQDDGVTREPLVQIRDLAYEAEYLINSYVVGNIHDWYLDLRLPSITQNIKLARERLQLTKEMQPSEVMMRYRGEVSDVAPAAADDDNHFVELQQSMTGRILADLIGKSKPSRQTILIFGMPGLGKTTIANKLYRCSAVSHYFDRRVWCVVSQTYSVRSLLINILTHSARELEKDDILKKSDAELGVDIHKSLKQRRYLIVLDDVWHSNAWYDLQRYLPDDGNGSRVILTSRTKDAAPDGSTYHALPLFSEDQCWDLLKKKMFLGDSCSPEFLSIGKGIAAKCCGIPLAVIVTAGILANLKREEDAWERVEKQLDAFLLDGVSGYRKILELSYEQLPHNMKPCFLYFAAFPEDAEISVSELAWRWMAEGFIGKNEGKGREQIAEMYLLELMNRSLVIPGKRRADGGIKTCRIHDLLRDICIMKANEENFLNSNTELSIYEKHQRSYLPSTSYTDSRPFGLHCRSLIGGLPDRSSCFQTRVLLKVLDLRPNKFQKIDDTSFDLPIQLRYLGVNRLTNMMVANLDKLEVINVVNSSQTKLPSIILRMKKLRHLLIKNEAIFEDNYSISETTNLRTLLFVCIYKRSDDAILRYSPHLQKLECNVGGENIFPDFSFLEELETLKMVFKVISFTCGEEVSNVKFPSSIKNLCLSNTKLPWKMMSLVGKLPNLCVLKLKYNAFYGYEWETLDGEFEELRFLKISQTGLKQWTSYYDHFPKLERLVIDHCSELVEIPCDLGNILTLQRIDVSGCLIRASLSAVQIEQEQLACGNEQLQVNITTRNWTKEELVALYKEKMENTENVSEEESDGNQMYALTSIFRSIELDFLLRNDGEQVKVNSLIGKSVGIYFSAFQQKSCQLFARKLLKVYNKLKKYEHFEIVFVSSGKDVNAESFNANFAKLPWLAIPLTDVDTRNKLEELFNVQRIPHLVILDVNGKVLTEEGVSIIEEDSEEGNGFGRECIPKIKQPEEEEDEAKWNDVRESSLVSETLDYVIDNQERKIPISNLVGKITMLFFAANWCPACVNFLPKLIQAYEEINKKYSNSLEVIFISDDEDIFSFDEFFRMMPWLALPFDDDREESLSRFYMIKALPMLVVSDPTGKTITVDGVDLVEEYGAKAYPFTSKRVEEIELGNDIMTESLPKKVANEVHKHELGLVKHIGIYECYSCNEIGIDWTYQCMDCNFDLHLDCALGNDYEFQYLPMKEDHEADDSLEYLIYSMTGDYVIDVVATKIPISNLVGKTTMLFFAGSRISQCRSFVPKLIQAYQEINERYNKSIEVIFISYDEEQVTFDEFFARMPWLALPFDHDRRESLARSYEVEDLPIVVVIGPTGKILTNEGYKLITCHGAEAYPFTLERVKEIEAENDKMAELWPKEVKKEVHEHELGLVKRIRTKYECDNCEELGWDWSYCCEDCDFDLHPTCALDDDDTVEAKRNDLVKSLFFSDSWNYVVDSGGTKIPVSNLVGKTIVLFFAVHWCPPCRFVLPDLIQMYQENNEKQNNSVEVIFISSDEDQSSFDDFLAMMPWLALPFGDDRIKSLIRLFNAMAIPMLVTIEPTGKPAASNVWELTSYPGAEAYPFTYEWVESQVKAQQMVIFWPKKMTNTLHDHELCLIKQILYDCNCCDEVGCDWSYKCDICVFNLHPNCAFG